MALLPTLAKQSTTTLPFNLQPCHHGSILLAKQPNIAFHNLCKQNSHHPGLRSLLGLGLNFCPRPKFTSSSNDVDLARFRHDASVKFFFQGSPPLPPTKLFIASDWQPREQHLTREFIARMDDFSRRITKLYESRACVTNLLSTQLATLLYIRKRHDLIVWKTDKNLGPAIIERDEYIWRALTDHLLDSVTYQPLTQTQAHTVTLQLFQTHSTISQQILGSKRQ